jgi:diadenosine tetraphosphate (Ap4A) HIT family hydrolase
MTPDFLGRQWTYDCMGCAVANHSLLPPGGLIAIGNHFYVHQDPLIPLPGFLVIGARRHFQGILDMRKDEYREFAELLRRTEIAIRRTVGVEFLTLVQEEHSNHFHLWFFPWTAEILAKYGPPGLGKIREVIADHRKQTIESDAWAVLEASIEELRNWMSDRANQESFSRS